MASANFWQRGEALDYTNSTDDMIPAGTVVTLEERIGVTGCDILPGEVGSVHVTGVFEIEKTGSDAIKMGKAVYFDGTGITDAADSNTPAGYAAEDAAAEAATIKVQIGG